MIEQWSINKFSEMDLHVDNKGYVIQIPKNSDILLSDNDIFEDYRVSAFRYKNTGLHYKYFKKCKYQCKICKKRLFEAKFKERTHRITALDPYTMKEHDIEIDSVYTCAYCWLFNTKLNTFSDMGGFTDMKFGHDLDAYVEHLNYYSKFCE